ncbi:uncharacterized protein LOC123669575 [Melitaea cinxia]|uniref:uncharacterized protein LOC123669575 n=1 Tax=Melitaea cinxia TaxID=113334 RepID=UPI001E2747DF|nr:uncharacterized protein LOC123669575 [Melitaea cinxia]
MGFCNYFSLVLLFYFKMPQCSALNCKNRGVHLFPKESKRRKQWESALRIINFKASNTARLCAAHFTEEDYYGKSKYTGNEPLAKFLKKTAVPSVFCFTKVKPENPAALERQHRFERRCIKKLFQESHTSVTIETERDLTLAIGREEEVNNETTSAACSHSAPEFDTKTTQVDHEHTYGSINRNKNNDTFIKFYTGFESYKKFQLVYSTLSPMVHKIRYYGGSVINLSAEDQFFLTLMKLRQNKCNFELSMFFNVSQSTVSNIFITWVNFIYQLWIKLDIWPRKELVQYYMPRSFKNYDSTLRVILDGTEIKVQKPKNPKSQQASWSSYKHANTLKILVGATPGGLLSYCSQAYAGSISDRQAVERSELLKKCKSGDSILYRLTEVSLYRTCLQTKMCLLRFQHF